MRDEQKTKTQLITEIAELRRKLEEMEAAPSPKNERQTFSGHKPKLVNRSYDKHPPLSDENLIKAFHANPNSMSITTLAEGRFFEVNDTFVQLVGRPREELIGKTVKDLGTSMKPTFEEMVKLLKKQGTIRGMEVQFQKKSGETKIGRLTAEQIQLNGENCILIMLEDITEYKKKENETARLERLDLIGQMAAGIGHEIRNPMTTVRGFLQMLSNKENDSGKKEYFNIMINELDRANSIITEFLSLAKDRLVKLGPVCVNMMLNNLYPVLSVEAINQGKRIILKKSDIPKIMANEKEIRQLIINLVRNGLEAMLPKGTLYISTCYQDNEVWLFVEDEGTGIETEILDKLGTPFVTTKDSGTGLGLAVCYSIANRHNARIDVATSPEGTTFVVRFALPVTQVTPADDLVACSSIDT